MAFGVMMALLRKAREGGSWHVRVSLAQTGHWLKGLGPAASTALPAPDPKQADIADLLDEMDTPLGRLTFVRHAAHAVGDAGALGAAAGAARRARADVAGAMTSRAHGVSRRFQRFRSHRATQLRYSALAVALRLGSRTPARRDGAARPLEHLVGIVEQALGHAPVGADATGLPRAW